MKLRTRTEDILDPEVRFSLPDATTTGQFKKLLSNIEYGGAPFSGSGGYIHCATSVRQRFNRLRARHTDMVQDERKKKRNKKKRFEHAETSGKGKRAKWSPTFFKSVYLSKGKEDDYIKRASLFRRPPRPIETETYLSSRRRPCPRLAWYSPNYLVKDYCLDICVHAHMYTFTYSYYYFR